MTPATAKRHPDIVYPATIPFVVLHVACFAAIWTGVTTRAVLLFVLLYGIRVFGITAGYHRYFSHRSFRTSRGFQFVLALLAQSTTMRGVIWWAATHRHHHLHSDTELDPHSVRQHGFWYAHMGWIFAKANDKPDYSNVQDLTRFPELVWLDRHPYLLPTALAVVPCWFVAGWSGVVVGFAWSTTLLYHMTFAINSLAHGRGTRPYLTGDDSSNLWLLSVFTMGEGWHNNHHAYQTSARLGFQRHELDPGYWILRMFEKAGIVRDLRQPPEGIVSNSVEPARRALERAAADLANAVRASDAAVDVPARAGTTAARIQAFARSRFPDVPAEHLRGVAVRALELLVPGAVAGNGLDGHTD